MHISLADIEKSVASQARKQVLPFLHLQTRHCAPFGSPVERIQDRPLDFPEIRNRPHSEPFRYIRPVLRALMAPLAALPILVPLFALPTAPPGRRFSKQAPVRNERRGTDHGSEGVRCEAYLRRFANVFRSKITGILTAQIC